MLYLALLLILLTVYLFTISNRAGIILWGTLSPLLAHFQYLFAGLPLLTYNKYTIIPAFLIHFFSGNLARSWHRLARGLLVPLILYQFVMFVMVWRSEPLSQTFQYYLDSEVIPILLFLIIISIDWKREQIIRFVWIVFGSLLIVSLVAIFEHFTRVPVFFSMKDTVLAVFPHRPTGTYMTVAALNTVLSIAMFLVSPVVLRARTLAGRVFAWVGMGVIFYANILAFYRGIIAPMIVMLLIVVLREPSRRGKTIFWTVILSIILGAYSVRILESRTYQDRIAQVATVNTRMATYIHALKIIAEKPLVGWGMFETSDVMEAQEPTTYKGSFNRMTPHNSILLFLIEEGIIGLGVIALWLGSVLRVLIRNYRAARHGTMFEKDFLFSGVLTFVHFILINLTLTSWAGTSNMFIFMVVALQMAFARTVDTESHVGSLSSSAVEAT